MAGRKSSGTAGGSMMAAAPSPSASSSVSSRTRPERADRSERASRTHRGLTCANCRARKTRCDGSQPTCKTCEVYRDTCRYEKPPPMSQIVAMARRLQEAEQTVAALRRELEAKEQQQPLQTLEISPKREATGDYLSPLTVTTMDRDGQAGGRAGSVSIGVSPDSQTAHAHAQAQSSPGSRPSQDLLFDLSVDSNGKLCYVGPTSAVHNPPVIEAHTSPIQTYDDDDDDDTNDQNRSQPYHGGQGQHSRHGRRHPQGTGSIMSGRRGSSSSMTTRSDVRTLLTTKAIESRAWEEFALGSAAAQTEIPRAAVAKLLQIHWVWIAPMFMWVYRPAFMRDMARGEGKYYSPLLLVILCGHAARFQEGGGGGGGGGGGIDGTGGDALIGDALVARARLLLGAEIHRPSSIPTVQALLQLSARDLAYGQISQAWLYSGMAFRMVSDLGLQHSSSGQLLSLGNLNAEDLEIRRRLYWSCYFWDKAMSLYLGRMPTLVDLPFDSSPELLDDFAEHELWTPFYGASQNLSRVSVGAYPPMKSHAISCFANTCRLSIILCDIILQLYSYSRRRRSGPGPSGSGGGPGGPENVDAALIQGIRERLDAWRASTPPHLLCDPDRLPDVCCPPHILTQNLLYYTTIILLHRPFYSSPVHHAECRQAADQLERLLLLLERTFGFDRITYLMAYCAYTGASVLVQDVKLGDAAAAAKIQTFLRALRLGVASCPLLQRSLDIITDSLPPEALSTTSTSASAVLADPPSSSSSLSSGSTSAATPTNASAAAAAAAAAATTEAVGADTSVSSGALAPDALLMRNYLPAFPYYHTQLDFFDGTSGGIPSSSTVGSTNGNGNGNGNGSGLGGGGDAYDLAAMDIDAFSLLDCFPENHLDSAAAAAWYMPQ